MVLEIKCVVQRAWIQTAWVETKTVNENMLQYEKYAIIIVINRKNPPGGGALGISGWECVAGTLEPLTYTRASKAEFCYPILE